MNNKPLLILIICNAVICITLICAATYAAVCFSKPSLLAWYLLVPLMAVMPSGKKS